MLMRRKSALQEIWKMRNAREKIQQRQIERENRCNVKEKMKWEGEFTLRSDPWAGLIASCGSFLPMVQALCLSYNLILLSITLGTDFAKLRFHKDNLRLHRRFPFGCLVLISSSFTFLYFLMGILWIFIFLVFYFLFLYSYYLVL